MITRPIGERFYYDDVLLEVVEDQDPEYGCTRCFFDKVLANGLQPCRRHSETGECLDIYRSDKRHVFFKQVEEGGEDGTV